MYTHTKALDASRPVSIVLFTNYANDKAAQFYDILGLNRYHAWYSDVGEMEIVRIAAKAEATNWMTRYNKPLIYTEYGADTVTGLHMVNMHFLSFLLCSAKKIYLANPQETKTEFFCEITYILKICTFFAQSPSWLFTEEWQEEYMREHFKAFDEMRTNTTYTFIGNFF